MRVRFYIEKRKDANGKLQIYDRPIFMTVAFHGKRVLISTGKKVDHQWWDPEVQKVRDTHPKADLINMWLFTLSETASVTWKALSSLSENAGVDDFRKEFEKRKPRFSGGFFDVLVRFLEQGSTQWSERTYKKVRTFYHQLRDFEMEESYGIGFHNMNDVFLERYVRHNEKRGKSGATIYKMVNTLVWFLNWATKEGFNVYSDYKGFYAALDYKKKHSKKVLHYLKWSELEQLRRYSPSDPKEQRVCDLFCLMAYSGLRYLELNTLEREDVQKEQIVVRKPNGTKRFIPLNDHARAIVDQYRDRFYRNNAAFPRFAPVTFNKYIRSACKKAGIDRPVPTKDGDDQQLPISQVIAAGTAVQTFIMNALEMDVSPEVIGHLTGVRKDQRIKLLQQEMAKRAVRKFDER